MIRAYDQTDIDQVLNIWLDASIKAHNFIDKGFWESKVIDMREIYLPGSEIFVFEEDEIVKGFVALCGDTLAAIFVSPNEQGKGIGKQLIDRTKEVRRNLNLTVYKDNRDSIEFYKKCGFKVTREQIDVHTGHVEIVMIFNS
ncbi:MAG TPA: GNAT family N-acetyltransferase [Synergistales bacterium]|nr:GNAT family N-acetyltransferase [Synergistales bacterium]